MVMGSVRQRQEYFHLIKLRRGELFPVFKEDGRPEIVGSAKKEVL